MTPEEFSAALAGLGSTPASKGEFYNEMLGSGMSDAELRALVDATMGTQSDTDWQYLQQIAGVQNAAGQGVADKATAYNDLQAAGMDDPSIRNLVTDAVGPQTDTDWSWLTSADKVLDSMSGTVADKASTYNDLVKSQGADNTAKIISDVAGPQTSSDMNWLTDAALIQSVYGGTADQKANTYDQLLQSGRSPFEIKQIATDAVGPQSDADWANLETKAAVKGPLPQQPASSPVYQSSLIENLRGNNTKPFSNNPGVSMMLNPANPKPSGWKPPALQNASFNPGVFTQTPATAQQVGDWNAYNAYRSSSVGASQPYLSLLDWITNGRPTGVSAGSSGSGGGSGGSSGGSSSGDFTPGG